MQLFACYHKQDSVCKSDVVKPIHVGKEIATVDLGLIGDNTGDNISFKFKTYDVILPKLKWGGYLWNYNRLTYPMNYQFLTVFANEFKDYQRKGLLIKQMWRKGVWRKLMRLFRCPLFFFVYSYLRRQK